MQDHQVRETENSPSHGILGSLMHPLTSSLPAIGRKARSLANTERTPLTADVRVSGISDLYVRAARLIHEWLRPEKQVWRKIREEQNYPAIREGYNKLHLSLPNSQHDDAQNAAYHEWMGEL